MTIKLMPNGDHFEITNEQFEAIHTIIDEAGWDLDYDIIEHDEEGMVTRYVWLWEHRLDPDLPPLRHHIALDGELLMTEEVTWDWKDIQHDA